MLLNSNIDLIAPSYYIVRCHWKHLWIFSVCKILFRLNNSIINGEHNWPSTTSKSRSSTTLNKCTIEQPINTCDIQIINLHKNCNSNVSQIWYILLLSMYTATYTLIYTLLLINNLTRCFNQAYTSKRGITDVEIITQYAYCDISWLWNSFRKKISDSDHLKKSKANSNFV